MTLADKAILSGADNRPPMLEKDMYKSWKSLMELYRMNRQHKQMIFESVENGPLIWPTIEENGVSRPRKYSKLTHAKAIQVDFNLQQQQAEFPQLDSGLTVPVLKQGDDPIDAINHMMSFLSVVIASCYPTINNQLRNSSNPRQQATINDGRISLQPVQERQVSFATGDDSDAYYFDYDELNTAKVALKANLSHYGSDVLDEEKDLVITTLNDELRKLIGKDLADNTVTKHNIALEMLKVDVEPIAPKLLNNRTVHSDYLRHTQEQAAILREVVE
uniref:Integrase, catalytic region, zinc finger, CCHC-type, peptidase aspartic, catalytic n=1 Tax=Tanacetum cinerariifolium TaxID=118510 RepID=A0A6L2MZU3_TANCI|nr:hypothetical protein [Tanacetum cinerariifolium]